MSSINFDENLDNDNLDLVYSTMSNLSLADTSNSSLENSEENHDDVNNENKPVSHLWTSLSKNDGMEIDVGLLHPAEMEIYHGITPKSGTSKRRNPDMFNPLKVWNMNNALQGFCITFPSGYLNRNQIRDFHDCSE